MKTIIRYVAILLVFFISSFNFLYSYSFIKDGIYYDIKDYVYKKALVCCKSNTLNGGVVSANYSGHVAIPSVVEYGGFEYDVIGIDDYAFSECESLLGVTIPSSVTSIGKFAFGSCRNLSSLSIPNSVVEIGEGAFVNTGIQKLVIEDGNSSIIFSSNSNEYTTPLFDIYIGRNINKFKKVGPYLPKSKKVIIGKNVTDLKDVKNLIDLSECNELISYAVCPPDGTLYDKNKRIIVPPSCIDAYKEKWSPTNNELILPIVDVMFFSQTNSSEYREMMESIDKSDVRSIGFYGDGIDESLTEEILTEGLNPNCVFFASENVGLGWKNTIFFESNISKKLELDSRYPCGFPIETFVQDFSISHTPSVWADGNKGWETIALPFECTNVEASEKGAIAPVMLGSSGNFWLRQYVGSSDDAVYFASTSDGVMKANTPYLIAFPGDKMGKGSLEGQTITFKAKNVTIPVTTIPSIQKNGYTFVGNYDKTADEGGGWTLNAEGSAFVWSETVGDKPFSAYFKGEAPAAGASALRMSFGQMDNATGLEQNMADLIDHADETVYTLDGRKVNTKDLKPGLYIKNHKKMMVR